MAMAMMTTDMIIITINFVYEEFKQTTAVC